MKCDNQATAPVHMLKSGETVYLYGHLTGEQDQYQERTDSIKTSSSNQASLKSAANQDQPRHVHSISTQTDHDVIYGSTVAMTTRKDGTKDRDQTNTKRYNSTGTETDLNAFGSRRTLESLLRWALAICTSEGDLSDQDAQELQYPNRNTSPLSLFRPQVYQERKTASDSQHSIDLEYGYAEYGYSNKGNNDPSSDGAGETFRKDLLRDGGLLGRPNVSSLGSSNKLHEEENLIQTMEIEHHTANVLQSTAATSDHLQVNVSCLDRTNNKRQETGIGVAISDHLQVNVSHLDWTPDKRQESGIGMTISDHLQAPSRLQELGSGMAPLGDQSIGMNFGQHLPVYAADGTCIKTEYAIKEDNVVQGRPRVGYIEEDYVIQGGPCVGDIEENNIVQGVPHVVDIEGDSVVQDGPRVGDIEEGSNVQGGPRVGDIEEDSVVQGGPRIGDIEEDYVIQGGPCVGNSGKDNVVQGGPHVGDIEEDNFIQGGPCVGEIEKDNVFQGGSWVGDSEEAIIYSDVFDRNLNMNTSQSASMAPAVVLDYSYVTQPEDHLNDMETSMQAEERPYKCNVCGKRSKKRRHMMAHLRIHANEKVFQCDVCEKKFTTNAYLKVHMRVHSQEKPYACTICTRSFSQFSGLTYHMRVHSQEKPYACTICQRRFTASGNLKTHMRVHTGERPYLCQICGKRYRHQSGIKSHLAVHSRDKQ